MKVFVSFSTEAVSTSQVDLFCSSLDAALARRSGNKNIKHVINDSTLKTGDDWKEKLTKLIDECEVFLPLYSPIYFSSDACGRELSIFLSKFKIQKSPDTTIPITPVWWDPTMECDSAGFPIPPTSGHPIIDNIQHRSKLTFKYGNFSSDDLTKKGLRYFISNASHPDFKPIVDAFFDELANQIEIMTKLHDDSRRVNEDWNSSTNIWCRSDNKLSIGHQRKNTIQVNNNTPRVNFMVIAADPNEIAQIPTYGERLQPAYIADGGCDWQPFFPTAGSIIAWLQSIIIRNTSDLISVEVNSSKDLKNIFNLAEKCAVNSQPFFLVVDGWTAHLPKYAEIISQFAERALPYCAVIVQLSRVEAQIELETIIHDLLEKREAYEDELCTTHITKSPKDLEASISMLHEKMKMKFRANQARRIGKKIAPPFSGGVRPQLSTPTHAE
jgi:hypothetical protein